MKRILTIILVLISGVSLRAEKLGQFHRGLDSLTYIYEPLADKPITLFYYIPTTGNIKSMPVLIAFHGAERYGLNPITCWKEFAERDGFVVLSPEFDRALYDENQYQFGNVFETSRMEKLNPEEKWVYSAIEPMFEFFKSQTGNRSKSYSIQGHSAGGQFVHRYLIAKPDAKVDVAVASNAGFWTMLSDDDQWPYSIHGTPFDDKQHIESYLKRNMTVHLGDSDTLTSGPHIANSPQALAQGPHRFARGQYYFNVMKQYAADNGYTFGWDIRIVKGVGHRGRGMVYAKSFRDENGKRCYSADQIRKTGAYWIIFGN